MLIPIEFVLVKICRCSDEWFNLDLKGLYLNKRFDIVYLCLASV